VVSKLLHMLAKLQLEHNRREALGLAVVILAAEFPTYLQPGWVLMDPFPVVAPPVAAAFSYSAVVSRVKWAVSKPLTDLGVVLEELISKE